MIYLSLSVSSPIMGSECSLACDGGRDLTSPACSSLDEASYSTRPIVLGLDEGTVSVSRVWRGCVGLICALEGIASMDTGFPRVSIPWLDDEGWSRLAWPDGWTFCPVWDSMAVIIPSFSRTEWWHSGSGSGGETSSRKSPSRRMARGALHIPGLTFVDSGESCWSAAPTPRWWWWTTPL